MFRRCCRRLTTGSIQVAVSSLGATTRCTGTNTHVKGGMRVRLTLSAKVAEVKCTSVPRGTVGVRGVSGVPGLIVRKVFARFTETSRASHSPTLIRLSHCLHFTRLLRGENIRVPMHRYSGDTNVVHIPRTGLGIIHTNVAVCNVCPSRRMRHSVIGLAPTVRLGDRMSCIGGIRHKATMDCKKAFIARHFAEVTAVPMNCTSNCPERLSGGN